MTAIVLQLEDLAKQLKDSFPALQALYLFGSQTNGQATADSDVDLAAFVDQEALATQPLLGLDMGAFCERQLQRPVDFVVMNRANPILQHEILAARCRLYEADPTVRAMAELRAFRLYLDNAYYLMRRRLD